jgi:hypothetical protein
MIFSLQKRFLALLLLPVILILLVLGLASFLYARSFLLDQWNLTTKLGLEKTARQIRMRLDEKREMMELIVSAEEAGNPTQSFLLKKLNKQVGVLAANLLTVPVVKIPIEKRESTRAAGTNSLSMQKAPKNLGDSQKDRTTPTKLCLKV